MTSFRSIAALMLGVWPLSSIVAKLSRCLSPDAITPSRSCRGRLPDSLLTPIKAYRRSPGLANASAIMHRSTGLREPPNWFPAKALGGKFPRTCATVISGTEGRWRDRTSRGKKSKAPSRTKALRGFESVAKNESLDGVMSANRHRLLIAFSE